MPDLIFDLGPIFLDLLGLQVDLSEITLDMTAVRGPGNLLCGLVGILGYSHRVTGAMGSDRVRVGLLL